MEEISETKNFRRIFMTWILAERRRPRESDMKSHMSTSVGERRVELG